jgi:pimeloyl-ACP methyl ester carboxylesterase
VVDVQEGPVLMVGHSWGGAVITEAGNHPKVKGLVYVAAGPQIAGSRSMTGGNPIPRRLARQKSSRTAKATLP